MAEQQIPDTPAWPFGGYAPGNYMCKCLACGQSFEGDKRAYECLECVVRRVKPLLAERRRSQAVTVPDGKDGADAD